MKTRYSTSRLKRLASDLLQQRWLFLLATVGTIVQVVLTIYLPILIGEAIDSVLFPDAGRYLLPILSKMGIVIVANALELVVEIGQADVVVHRCLVDFNHLDFVSEKHRLDKF